MSNFGKQLTLRGQVVVWRSFAICILLFSLLFAGSLNMLWYFDGFHQCLRLGVLEGFISEVNVVQEHFFQLSEPVRTIFYFSLCKWFEFAYRASDRARFERSFNSSSMMLLKYSMILSLNVSGLLLLGCGYSLKGFSWWLIFLGSIFCLGISVQYKLQHGHSGLHHFYFWNSD